MKRAARRDFGPMDSDDDESQSLDWNIPTPISLPSDEELMPLSQHQMRQHHDDEAEDVDEDGENNSQLDDEAEDEDEDEDEDDHSQYSLVESIPGMVPCSDGAVRLMKSSNLHAKQNLIF